MREQNSAPTEYGENWDTGTYQTGASSPRKRQSVLITVLLMAVIFLGGIASALGIMNVRLIHRLIQQENAELYLSADGSVATEVEDNAFFHSDRQPDTRLPEEETLERRLGFRVEELNALGCQYWQLTSGVQVTAVTDSDCPLQEGDILIYLNDEQLTEIEQLFRTVDTAARGDQIRFGVLRAGKQLTVELPVED